MNLSTWENEPVAECFFDRQSHLPTHTQRHILSHSNTESLFVGVNAIVLEG